MSENNDQESIDLHKKFQGKISIKSLVGKIDSSLLSKVYTPGVASVSKAIALDKELVKEYTLAGRTVAVLSNGSAVLGLGNIGPEAAMPVMEGKALLFKECAGIDAFPICIKADTAQEIIEVAMRISPTFGAINLEDIKAPICFEVEKVLREKLSIPVMHDDQHGTAVVVLAGLINASKLRGGELSDYKVSIIGAGAAGIAVAELLHLYGIKNIVLSDSKGIVSLDRDDLTLDKKNIAEILDIKIGGTYHEMISESDVVIGVSSGGKITKEDILSMNEKPIIFALANPNPEILPDEANRAGAFIIATGRSDFPNQVNNALAFPGLFKGALLNPNIQFSNNIFIKAAQNLANFVKEPSTKKILPEVFEEGVADAVSKAFSL
jgi:malate dehydrogenase (oxaloacetate-decarboxylating)